MPQPHAASDTVASPIIDQDEVEDTRDKEADEDDAMRSTEGDTVVVSIGALDKEQRRRQAKIAASDPAAELLSSTTPNPLGFSCPTIGVRVAGFIALAVLIWSWVLQAEVSQELQSTYGFNKPYFIVCFNHTGIAIFFPVVVVYYKYFGTPQDRYETSWFDVNTLLGRHMEIRVPQMWRIAAFLSVFSCVMDYFWFAALTTVNVAAGTAIFNSSPLFVYCFSICFLGEHIVFTKVAGVLTAFAGVLLIVMFHNGVEQLDLSATALERSNLLGGMLVLLSAALYGAYEVVFKVVVGKDLTHTPTLLVVTGMTGIMTVPIWILGSLALSVSPIESLHEPLGWPTSGTAVAMLVLTGSLGGLFNVALPLSLSWTSPLETSVGCMLTIPLSGLLDSVLHGTQFSNGAVLGSILVMSGFGILEYASSSSHSSLPSSPLPSNDSFMTKSGDEQTDTEQSLSEVSASSRQE